MKEEPLTTRFGAGYHTALEDVEEWLFRRTEGNPEALIMFYEFQQDFLYERREPPSEADGEGGGRRAVDSE